MPRLNKRVHPIVSALVLLVASVTTSALYMMYQAIVIAEDLSLVANILDTQREERL